jgi:hypothetical protein
VASHLIDAARRRLLPVFVPRTEESAARLANRLRLRKKESILARLATGIPALLPIIDDPTLKPSMLDDRLLHLPAQDVMKNRLDAFTDFAREYGVVTVLKGAQTVVTDPGGQRYINPTGNSGLAKGGSGDVLTGMTAALIAQGLSCFEAACAACWLHGAAGDEAAGEKGHMGMTATDLIDALPKVLYSMGR